MARIYYDTETCGFYGQPVIIQYQVGNGEPMIHNFWTNKISSSIELILTLMHNPDGVVGFNLTFDHFQLQKIYTLLEEVYKVYGDIEPIWLLATDEGKSFLYQAEMRARDGLFLKPVKAMDLMLHAQKGPYQKCMDRAAITIRRVPDEAARPLAALLNATVTFEPILFTKRTADPWSLYDARDRRGNLIPGVKDVKCVFAPSLSLKNLVVDLGIVESTDSFKDIMPKNFPLEMGFAPYAAAFDNIKTPSQHKLVEGLLGRKFGVVYKEKLELPYHGTWIHYMLEHIEHWETNEQARTYALNDPYYTYKLDEAFGFPSLGDDDSELACCVATCRWKGYAVDSDALSQLKPSCESRESLFPEHTSAKKSLAWVTAAFTPIEAITTRETIGNKGDKVALQKLAATGSEAGKRAQIVLDARNARKELELIDKLEIAGRFHASFKIIGALSSRMSGADNLNAQGIKRDKTVRAAFPLAFPGYQLVGGDFSGFEVCIFEAVSNDERLRADLLSGKKIHGIFGTFVYPDKTYQEILDSEGTEDDRYTKSKSALFAMLYGGEASTLMERLGVSKEDAESAYQAFLAAYPGARRERLSIKEKFSPVQKEGPKFIWVGNENHITSLYGFKRYFDIEFQAAKALFDLANNLPSSWQKADIYVIRNQELGKQKLSGAIMSALYGAANQIQGAVFRQAANHRIQSTGAQITKLLERRIWDLQPVGAHECVVQPMNVHDEVMCPCNPAYVSKVDKVVETLLREVEPIIPLVKISWSNKMTSWAGKGK